MGFFRTLIQKREFSLARWENWLDTLGSGATPTGIEVTEEKAMGLAIVRGCVMVLAQDIAKVPLKIYKRVGEVREEASNHPLWSLFKTAANPYMTAYTFRQTMQRHIGTSGNAYALIQRDTNGRVVGLWPRHPATLVPKIEGDSLFYEYKPSAGKVEILPASRVFHLRGLGSDGISGESPIDKCKDLIALGLAYQQHAGYTFKNSVRPSLLAKCPVGPDKAKEIGEAIAKQYAGLSKTGGVLVGYGGLEFTPWGFNNKDAEFNLGQRFIVEELCRVWRVPPHKAMDYTESAYSNITSSDLAYVNDTLRPLQQNWEEEIGLQLMTEDERAVYYAEHDNFDLLKGTPVERANVETRYVQGGISSINEVRKSHNWKPVKGGDECRTQMQMVPLGANPQVKEGTNADGNA